MKKLLARISVKHQNAHLKALLAAAAVEDLKAGNAHHVEDKVTSWARLSGVSEDVAMALLFDPSVAHLRKHIGVAAAIIRKKYLRRRKMTQATKKKK